MEEGSNRPTLRKLLIHGSLRRLKLFEDARKRTLENSGKIAVRPALETTLANLTNNVISRAAKLGRRSYRSTTVASLVTTTPVVLRTKANIQVNRI